MPFFLRFSSYPFTAKPPTTLFNMVSPLVENTGFITSLASPAPVLYAYLLFAGLVGVVVL
ncbi:MAG: hypothetical protein QXO30_04725 [Candidatus Caldarchaeum sp.]